MRKMKRRIVIDVGLLITGGMIFWIILSIWNYYNKISLIEKISNEMMGNEAVYFRTTAEELDFQKLYEYLPENGILYNNLSWDKNYKSIIFKDNIPVVPMLKGQFFDKSDRGNRVVVVGKDIAADLEEENPIIDINGIEYKVIGIIGTDYHTKLDQAVWVMMNSENINCQNTFILDGLDQEKVLSYLGQAEIWKDILILDQENLSILEVIDRKKDYWIFPSMVILIGWSYSFILLHRWIQLHSNEIRIRRELGYSSFAVIRILFIKSIIPYLLGIVMAIFIMIKVAEIDRIMLPLGVSVWLFFLLWIVTYLFLVIKKQTDWK